MVRAIMAQMHTKLTNANLALLLEERTARRGRGCGHTAGDTDKYGTDKRAVPARGSAQRVQEVRRTQYLRARAGAFEMHPMRRQ